MISQMLARDPADRPNFDRILSTFRDSIFPEYFYTFLQEYVSSLAELPERADSSFLQRVSPHAGTKIDRLLDEWDSISIHLEGTGKGLNPSTHPPMCNISVMLIFADGPALLLLNVVTSSIRNCLWPSARLHGLQLFLNLSPYLRDEDKVDRIVPFAVELLSDDVAIVRAEACRVLVIVVSLWYLVDVNIDCTGGISSVYYPSKCHLHTGIPLTTHGSSFD